MPGCHEALRIHRAQHRAAPRCTTDTVQSNTTETTFRDHFGISSAQVAITKQKRSSLDYMREERSKTAFFETRRRQAFAGQVLVRGCKSQRVQSTLPAFPSAEPVPPVVLRLWLGARRHTPAPLAPRLRPAPARKQTSPATHRDSHRGGASMAHGDKRQKRVLA